MTSKVLRQVGQAAEKELAFFNKLMKERDMTGDAEILRERAVEQLRAAERAWHIYASSLAAGPTRTAAFAVFENVRNANRKPLDHRPGLVEDEDDSWPEDWND